VKTGWRKAMAANIFLANSLVGLLCLVSSAAVADVERVQFHAASVNPTPFQQRLAQKMVRQQSRNRVMSSPAISTDLWAMDAFPPSSHFTVAPVGPRLHSSRPEWNGMPILAMSFSMWIVLGLEESAKPVCRALARIESAMPLARSTGWHNNLLSIRIG
jgi:hypothetical protein